MTTFSFYNSPATLCPLSGAYLIEASAGTGKTWTLTGILLRLLIEKNVRPERIVATTFTRAAAQEMQERLHGRLDDFYQVCAWAKQHQSAFYDDVGNVLPTYETLLDTHQSTLPALSDPINRLLLYGVLTQTVPQLDKTLAKIRLLLATLDKMFIGTLDSLAQKWLKEFAHELGDVSQNEMITDPQDITYALVHDELRALHASICASSPNLYQLLDKKPLADVPAMCKSIHNALQFYTAKIDEAVLPTDDFLTHWQDELNVLLAEGFGEFEAFFEKDFRVSAGMNATLALTKHFGQLPVILNALTQTGMTAFSNLDKTSVSLIESFTSQKLTSCFKKNASGQAIWEQLPLTRLEKLRTLYTKYQSLNEVFMSGTVAYIANQVRKKLTQQLQDNKQTTFSANMLTLVQGLSGKKGELIARHIRHLYPVALIDEAQDVSGEQMALIERIYLSDTAKKSLFENSDKGFLLLVGDPKQAIYRFRGGDVANYHYMKSLGLDTRFSLLTNRRSNRAVIDGLNAWFGTGFDDEHDKLGGELGVDFDAKFVEQLTHLGDEIAYQKVTAVNDNFCLSWQKYPTSTSQALVGQTAITFLHLPLQSHFEDLLMAVALHINTLLQSDFCLYHTNTDARPILPSDIAVLLPTNSEVLQMQELLATLGISGVVDGGQSVFKGQACQDLHALLMATLTPKEEMLGLLLVQLFRFNLTDIQTLLQDDKEKANLLIYLKETQRLWLTTGLLNALNHAFLNPPFLKHNLWVHLASFEHSERYLADMWQLFELVSAWQLPMGQVLPHLHAQMTNDTSTTRVALPLSSGVAVMTMHKSKGLEFPIVYVVGLDQGVSKKSKSYKLYPYTERYERRLSPTKVKGDVADYFITLDQTDTLNEKKRLGYVALTRASEQIFVVGKDKSPKSMSLSFGSPMQAWMWLSDEGTYRIPKHLANKVSMISLETLFENGSFVCEPYVLNHTDLIRRTYPDWHAIYPCTQFVPERNTSFTGLARLFGTRFASQQHDYDEAENDTQVLDDGDIRAGFMKGANAGTFLHTVLELASEGEALPDVLLTTAKDMNLAIETSHLQALQLWLTDVLTLPFLASGVALMDIDKARRINELAFVLSLSCQQSKDGGEFAIHKLSEIFATYANVHLPAIINTEQIFAYLSGKIDLVYCYQNKYYIVDYKSNFLGNTINAYHKTAMQMAMDEHGYWLQASLYQLALHRLLSLKIGDYQGNEQQYLGAVEYVFLRGVSANDGELGRFVWQPPMALIWALDEFFG